MITLSPNGTPFSGMTIAILYSDTKREYFATEEHFMTEVEVFERAKIVAPYFEKMGATVHLIPGNETLSAMLKKINPTIVLNLVDSIRGNEYLSSAIPGTLELLDLSYIGSGILAMSMNFNKFLTKKMLEQYGLPVPRYQFVSDANEPINPLLRYPLISKMNDIHGAVEIDERAVAENERMLRERLRHLISTYKQGVLIEEFIAGRELTAVVLEGPKTKVYIGEKVFNEERNPGPYKIATFAATWLDEEKDPTKQSYHYEKYEPTDELKEDIKRAYDILKMEDYAKFDIRLDQSGRYYFIDPNVNPAFGPKESACALGLILDMYGIDFPEMLKRLVANVLNQGEQEKAEQKVEG